MGEAVSLLERPVYRYAQVDRLLEVPSGTARRWLNGYRRRGTSYPPFLRTEPSSSGWVTWGEFVEARLFAGYRRIDEIPARRLRRVIEILRERFHSRYPLAYAEPYTRVSGKEILLWAQEEAGLGDAFFVARTGQYVLVDWVEAFRKSVRFSSSEPRYATSIDADPSFPSIRWDPRLRGGEPVVDDRSIRVETVASLVAGGERIQDVANWYGLDPEQVEEAVVYCRTHRLIA